MRTTVAILLSFALVGCSPPSDSNNDNTERQEGVFTGDCDNGADDDGDGMFDCDDPGCSGAPTCQSSNNANNKGVPDGWLCDPALYDANDGCNCNCASDVRDPDCDKPNQTLLGCAAADATCNDFGVCATPDSCDDRSTCEGRVCGLGTDGCTPCGPTCADGFVCVAGRCESSSTNNTNGATNNTNGMPNNMNMNDFSTVALIQDSSSGESCEAFGDPGSDIFGAALVESGIVIGWANFVDGAPIDSDYTNSNVFDGSPPLLSGSCPTDFNSNTVYSLGCDGWVALEFLDAGGSGQAIELDPMAGYVIRVYEWGAQCTTGSTADVYGVYVCTDDDAVRMGDDSSCSELLGAAATGGEETFPVMYTP